MIVFTVDTEVWQNELTKDEPSECRIQRVCYQQLCGQPLLFLLVRWVLLFLVITLKKSIFFSLTHTLLVLGMWTPLALSLSIFCRWESLWFSSCQTHSYRFFSCRGKILLCGKEGRFIASLHKLSGSEWYHSMLSLMSSAFEHLQGLDLCNA